MASSSIREDDFGVFRIWILWPESALNTAREEPSPATAGLLIALAAIGITLRVAMLTLFVAGSAALSGLWLSAAFALIALLYLCILPLIAIVLVAISTVED